MIDETELRIFSNELNHLINKLIHNNIVTLIKEVERSYLDMYQVTFPIDVNLIVGGFGSNAYTYRQIIPNVTFALEKLSPKDSRLKVLIAHELGHVAHNIISDNKGIDWSMVEWDSPLTWLSFVSGFLLMEEKLLVFLDWHTFWEICYFKKKF